MRFLKAGVLTFFAATFLSLAQTSHGGFFTAPGESVLAAAAANTHYYGAVDLGSRVPKDRCTPSSQKKMAAIQWSSL
jgi:hypothetical protein